MNIKSVLFLACGALALWGCSSTPTRVNTGAIHARTFSFVRRAPGATPNYADNSEAVHAMIQDAITKNLAAKGVSRVEADPDVMVAYLVIVGNNASTAAINDYFGYGRDASGLADKAQDAYNSNKNPNYFEAGTLVIDVVDAKSFKLLKRGLATRQILRNPSADARAARIQEVVDQILGDLRIARRDGGGTVEVAAAP
jgi:hypothetical protein